jgi:hypothetical protein
MGKVTKKQMPMWAQTGHGKPVTRRDFLACGLIPFAASAFLPSVFTMLAPSSAHAADCTSAPGGGLIPFVTLNLAGGAGLTSNWVPRLASGDLLTSYSKLGLGNNTGANALEIESEFGVAAFSKHTASNFLSPLLRGIRETCTAETLAGTAFLGLAVQSQDDSSNNKFDASGLVFRAGLAGAYIPNLGTEASDTGIRQMASTIKPPAPLVVNNFGDIANSIGYTRALQGTNGTNGLTPAQQNKVAKLVSNLSNAQARKLASISTTAHVKDLIECAGVKNSSIIGGGAGVVSPPTNNTELLQRWGLNAGSFTPNANSDAVVFSSMVYNALMGNSGTVNLQMGGYDYHNGTRTTGDQRDQAAGQTIGRILDTARILGKSVFLYVTSDGSTVSQENATPGAGTWVSDRGDAGSAMIFMYRPPAAGGRIATSGYQIGSYTNGQVADASNAVGASPEVAAQAVFANYLKMNGKMELFDRVIPRGTLDAQLLAKVVKVG